MTPWEIDALELANCNCAFGCPCQFNALPTDGTCEAAVGFIINKGHYGDVTLDGVRFGMTAKWPAAIHMGNGTIQLIVDSAASPEQRAAVEAIGTGGDTEDMATHFWVFNKMSPISATPPPTSRRGRFCMPSGSTSTATRSCSRHSATPRTAICCGAHSP